MKTNEQAKKTRGPARLTYIPPQYRNIVGIEKLTTRAQLLRLREYLAVPSNRRAPYLRLGASVPDYRVYPDARASATYAVTYDGIVEIIHRAQDPRAAEHWMSRPHRPWYLSREFAGEVAS